MISPEEFTTTTARKVTLIDLDSANVDAFSRAFLSCDLPAEDEDDAKTDPMVTARQLAQEALNEPNSHQTLLNIIRKRPATGLSTKVRDLLEDTEGGTAVKRCIKIARQQKAFESLQKSAQDETQESQKSDAQAEGTYECLLSTEVLTRPLQAVVDAGASHNIVAYRAIRKLKLKGVIRPSKKAFITAGELSFPVGEIDNLPLTIEGIVHHVHDMYGGLEGMLCHVLRPRRFKAHWSCHRFEQGCLVIHCRSSLGFSSLNMRETHD